MFHVKHEDAFSGVHLLSHDTATCLSETPDLHSHNPISYAIQSKTEIREQIASFSRNSSQMGLDDLQGDGTLQEAGEDLFSLPRIALPAPASLLVQPSLKPSQERCGPQRRSDGIK